MTHPSVTIQVAPESVPSTPCWMGEVAAFAQVLRHVGLLNSIQNPVQCARARFGTYDTIDFVVVLLGDALSGERTLDAYYARLAPFAEVFMALFERDRLPDRSTLSRFLSALDQPTVEALRTQFQADLMARTPVASVGGLWDRFDQQYVVVDVDGTRQAVCQRALPQLPSLPAPHRRFDQVAAPGYTGREARRSRAHPHHTSGRAHTHQFPGTFGGTGNGDYRAELQRALQVITRYATTHKLHLAQILVRLDGLYGNAAVLTDILDADVGLIGRCRDYALWIWQSYRRCWRVLPLKFARIRKVALCVPCTIARISPSWQGDRTFG